MKLRDLVRELKSLGWWIVREGGNHTIWTNGVEEEPVPRHREVGEGLAAKIIKRVRTHPPRDS